VSRLSVFKKLPSFLLMTLKIFYIIFRMKSIPIAQGKNLAGARDKAPER